MDDGQPADVNLGIAGLSRASWIGSGGSATVFSAQTRDGTQVAVKVLRLGADRNSGNKAFAKELNILERLSGHTGIVPILNSGVTDRGEPYLTMPLMNGSIQDVLDEQGALPWRDAVSIMIEVGEAIAYAHGSSVLHRDIKPANLLLDAGGRPLVTDFGIGKLTDGAASLSSHIAMTPSFAAPELYSAEPASLASEVYSLGATLFALLSGSSPFRTSDRDSPESIMKRVLNEPPPDLNERHAVPASLAIVVERAMSKHPSTRYSSAKAFSAALRSAMSTEGSRPLLEPTVRLPKDQARTVRMSVQHEAQDAVTTTMRPHAIAPPAPQQRRMPLVAALALLIAALLAIVVVRNPFGQFVNDTQPASLTAQEGGIAAATEVPSTVTPEPAPTSTPEPAPTAIPTVEPTALPAVATADPDPLACLSTRQRVGQLLMPLITQPELTSLYELAALGEVAGIALLGTPDASIGDAIAALQANAQVPLHIASDEEGGVVQRLSGVIEPLPSALELAQRPSAEVQTIFANYGQRMREFGFTMAFAPVVDVGHGPGIGSRSFSTDPAVVVEYGRAVSDGYSSAGIVAVLKHFPGHGRASADTNVTLPTAPPLDELRQLDLIPFQQMLGAGRNPFLAVMVAHLLVPGLSDETPTSLSPNTINGLLRSEIGFDGLVITDAFNMGAIAASRTNAQATLEAINAGADLTILSSVADVSAVIDELVNAMAAGNLSPARIDEAAQRVLASKGQLDICS